MAARPKPQRFASRKEREQHEEMKRQKIRKSLINAFPDHHLCPACQTRNAYEDICASCSKNAEAYADGRLDLNTGKIKTA